MSGFKPWIEDDNINATQDYTTFVNDSQRQEGFKGGTPASAIRVNTALRQSSLVVAALMNALGISDELNYRNSLNDVQTAINTNLSNKITSLAKTTKSDNAINADNVTTNINGKAISDIFAANGTTVKNATYATSAGSANNTSYSSITFDTYIEIAQTSGSSVSYSTVAVKFSGYGLKIGSLWYGNLYYDCLQNKDGTKYTNVTSVKLSGNTTYRLNKPGIMYVMTNSNYAVNPLYAFYNYLDFQTTQEYRGSTTIDFTGSGNIRSCIAIVGIVLTV